MGDVVTISKFSSIVRVITYEGHLLLAILSHLMLWIRDSRTASLIAAHLQQGLFLIPVFSAALQAFFCCVTQAIRYVWSARHYKRNLFASKWSATAHSSLHLLTLTWWAMEQLLTQWTFPFAFLQNPLYSFTYQHHWSLSVVSLYQVCLCCTLCQ